MISVGCFSEMNCFDDNGSIKDFLVSSVDYDKKVVIKYLSSNKKIASCPRQAIDCVTGEVIQQSFSVYEDGEYTWCDFLVYHVEKYNVSLPKEFIKKIYNSINFRC